MSGFRFAPLATVSSTEKISPSRPESIHATGLFGSGYIVDIDYDSIGAYKRGDKLGDVLKMRKGHGMGDVVRFRL